MLSETLPFKSNDNNNHWEKLNLFIGFSLCLLILVSYLHSYFWNMYPLLLYLSELHVTAIESAYSQETGTSVIREESADVDCCLFYLIIFLVWSGLCHARELYCLGNLAARFLTMKITDNRLCIIWYFSWKEQRPSLPEQVRRQKPREVLWWPKRPHGGPHCMAAASAPGFSLAAH